MNQAKNLRTFYTPPPLGPQGVAGVLELAVEILWLGETTPRPQGSPTINRSNRLGIYILYIYCVYIYIVYLIYNINRRST